MSSHTAAFSGPLFVVGMPRSGTKLLRDLLNQHPRIGIPPAESEFLPDWARRWPAFGDLSQPAAFRRFAQEVAGSSYFVFLAEEQGYRVDVALWHATCPDYTLPGVFEALMRLDGGLGPDGRGVWGDKSPGYLHRLPLLDHLFPACRVVHIVRDCRDYAVSIRKAWGKDPLRAAQRWHDRVSGARAEGLRLGPERYLELRYEDLLADPEAALRPVAAFAGLDFDPRMTTLDRPSENLGDARGQARIVRSNAEKWRDMDPALRQHVEAIAGETLRALGYPVDYRGRPERLSPARMAAGQALDGIKLLQGDVAQRGLLGALRFRGRIWAETATLESRS